MFKRLWWFWFGHPKGKWRCPDCHETGQGTIPFANFEDYTCPACGVEIVQELEARGS